MCAYVCVLGLPASVHSNLQPATCGTRHKQSSAISVSAVIDSFSHAQLLSKCMLQHLYRDLFHCFEGIGEKELLQLFVSF